LRSKKAFCFQAPIFAAKFFKFRTEGAGVDGGRVGAFSNNRAWLGRALERRRRRL
jgi:hypothetical protein